MNRATAQPRGVLWVIVAILSTVACQEASTMGIQASPVDTRKYFTDPRLAEFADHVQKGDLAKVQAGLRAGVSPNAPGLQGFTPLFFVFPAKSTGVARELLKAGANPNARLEDGTPPLMFAVRMDNPDFTQVLLEYKADPNARGGNKTPMVHEAVLAKATHNIRLLAKAGADLNVIWGASTPLVMSVESANWEAAAALLDAGADATWQTPGKNPYAAADIFCRSVPGFQPTDKNRGPISDLFAAFERRGVKLPCAAEAMRFR